MPEVYFALERNMSRLQSLLPRSWHPDAKLHRINLKKATKAASTALVYVLIAAIFVIAAFVLWVISLLIV